MEEKGTGDATRMGADVQRQVRYSSPQDPDRLPTCPTVAASIESLSAAGGGLRWTASLPSLLGGDHESDSLNGAGTRRRRPGGRAGGQQSRRGRNVEVRV